MPARFRGDFWYLLGALRRAVKDQLYAELKTNLTNGLSESSTIEIITPWWQSLILALRIVTGVGCAAFVVLYLLKLREGDATVSVTAASPFLWSLPLYVILFTW